MNRSFSLHLTRLRRANAGWQASLPRRWLRAWLTELRELLPEAIRVRLASDPQTQVLPWPLPANADTRLPVRLMLPYEEVLAPQLTLPVAATGDLRQVLSYEMDKYTPLSADQVHFSAYIEAQGKITARVRLVAVDRQRLAKIIEQCRDRALTLRSIDARDSDGQVLGVDLLPAHLRPAPPIASRVNRGLTALALGLSVTLMAATLHNREAGVAAMAAEVAEQRREAETLDALRRELTDTEGAARYLSMLKSARPTLVRVVSELGQCLGADTWLEQLEVRENGELALSGQSRHASALIGHARSCASLADVRFNGIIQADPETGLDRFSLAARLTEEAADAPIPDTH